MNPVTGEESVKNHHLPALEIEADILTRINAGLTEVLKNAADAITTITWEVMGGGGVLPSGGYFKLQF